MATTLSGCCWQAAGAAEPPTRLRVIVETDAGGDPDDEQSLVRFLLYANQWDVEGIIANRRQARDGENLNPERGGLGIVRSLVKAYGRCAANLRRHDPRYPSEAQLAERVVSGYADNDAGVKLILAAADGDDPRPIWFLNWGTDHGSDPSSLRRALDLVLAQRGPPGYAKFKSRFRLSSDDQFGDHTSRVQPSWPLWVDTFRPELERRRWYHRFSALTATAGGFDVRRDVLSGHGPLGAMYPTNTTHRQKEGDSMTFLYLVPTGMNDPEQPTWGSWGGRYGVREGGASFRYYWANQRDTWQGATHRDQTVARWAAALQNDFRARLDWCVAESFERANHPPRPHCQADDSGAILHRTAGAGERLALTAAGSSDPDGQRLSYHWYVYPEAGTYTGAVELRDERSPQAALLVPADAAGRSIHVLLELTDDGQPPLTRYRRVVVEAK